MPETVSTPSLALPTWSYKLKKAAWIGLGIIGFLFALILIVPHFVDLGVFKRTYLPLVEEALTRQILFFPPSRFACDSSFGRF